MKHLSKMAAVAALVGLAACSTTPPPAPPAPPPPVALADTDAAFVQSLSDISLTETALGKVAVTNSSTTGVKSFAQNVISDYSNAQSRLAAIASAHGTTLATDPGADSQKTIATLGAVKGGKFDHAYVAHSVESQKKALDLATQEASSTSDVDLKSFATDLQQTAQRNLDAAKALVNHKGHTSGYHGYRGHKRHTH